MAQAQAQADFKQAETDVQRFEMCCGSETSSYFYFPICTAWHIGYTERNEHSRIYITNKLFPWRRRWIMGAVGSRSNQCAANGCRVCPSFFRLCERQFTIVVSSISERMQTICSISTLEYWVDLGRSTISSVRWLKASGESTTIFSRFGISRTHRFVDCIISTWPCTDDLLYN